MAQVIQIKTAGGAGMMLRGKLGNQVFQVRNGKQIVMHIPRKRTSPPSEKEIEHRQRFATLTQAINRLTPEQWEWLRKEWEAAGYKYKGKKYCTLRGYAYAFCNRCAKVHTVSMVGVTLPATPSFRSQKSIGFSMLNERATDASALPTGRTPLAPVGDPNKMDVGAGLKTREQDEEKQDCRLSDGAINEKNYGLSFI
ncbi:MAG: hypothetical protein IJP45_05025 [Paludibacteraceae bacterium]|nr:hypothetical protein [Paludibacteraceae bacterium]